MLKIISYDLRKPEQNYEDLIKAIKTYNCRKINKSDWVIWTSSSCKEVRDYLQKYIDNNDTLFVAKLDKEWSSYGLNSETTEWLKN